MEGKNVLASVTGNVPVIEEGEKGAKGATERPRSWEEIPDGSAIESGTGNEQWIDIVLYGDDFYQCIRSFTKGNGVVPTNTIYFKPITDYKRLATGLFLARKGYIKNLMVNDIYITGDGTETGNVLLKADKDGITCNTGTFKNVDISGKVTATSGFVGNFTIADGSIKYVSAAKTCEVCTDYVQYVDLSKTQSLYFGYGDSGVKAEFAAKDNNGKDMTCSMISGVDDVGKNKIVALTTTMTGYTSKLTPRELKLGDYFHNYVQFRVANDISNFGYHGTDIPTTGLKCLVDKKASALYLFLAGIPSGIPSVARQGMIYEENGILKIYKGR